MASAMGMFGELAVPASPEYVLPMDVQKYLQRCKSKKVRNFTNVAKNAILKMEAELKKEESNMSATVFEECMNVTYQLRRECIIYHQLSIRNCMEVFPGLRSYFEIRREFQRNTNVDVNDFERRVDYMMEGMSGVEADHECRSIYCRLAQSLAAVPDGQCPVILSAARAFIFGCKQTSSQWWDNFFYVTTFPLGQDEARSIIGRLQPTIVILGSAIQPGNCSVYVEKIRVLRSLNFLDAILACFYLNYVFNLEYTTNDAKIFGMFDSIMRISNTYI